MDRNSGIVSTSQHKYVAPNNLVVRAMAGSGQRSKTEQKDKTAKHNQKKQSDPACYTWNNLRTKQDDSVSIGLFEALAGRSLGSGENDINPLPIQRGRIGGPGRG